MLSPRLDVMNPQPTATFTTVLTGPVVSLDDSGAELLVLGARVISGASGTVTTFPEGMRWPFQLPVGGANSGAGLTDRCSMLRGQRSSCQRCGDARSLLRRHGSPKCCGPSSAGGSDFCANIGPLRWIVVQVRPSCSARPRTEANATVGVEGAALVAVPPIDLSHAGIIPERKR